MVKWPYRHLLLALPGWLWGNEENGIDGAYGSLPFGWPHTGWPKWRQIFVWSAWRNSVGNARWSRLFGMTVDPAKVLIVYPLRPPASSTIFDRVEGPYLVRQGWQYELKFCWNPQQIRWQDRRYFWLGWRIAQYASVTADVGFAFQPWSKL